MATGLHEAATKTFEKIEAKDADGLLDVGDQLDKACENCHLKYWYPNEKRPDAAPSTRK